MAAEQIPSAAVEHAVYYIEQLGWGLCSIPPGTKGPVTDNWNAPAMVIDTADKARAMKPGNGIGLIHAASGTCALDIDDVPAFALILEQFGLELEQLLGSAPRIIGKPGRDKAVFRLPAGFTGNMHKLTWPKRDAGGKPVTVFELRLGPVQDVLPPSVHPDTQQPYAWRDGTAPWQVAIPELPAPLIAMLKDWDSFKVQMMAMCPWAVATDAPKPKPRKMSGEHSNVIGQFNDAHDVRAILEVHGYKRKGKRYLAPTSSSNLAGVNVLHDTHVFSHHASDPLNDGFAHDAFDLFTILEYNGDVGAAIAAAAQLLGIEFQRPTPVDISKIVANVPKPKAVPSLDEIPAHLLTVPGALGHVVEYANATAPKPQPLFAVQSALALGSVMCGRRYRSTEKNFASMYYLCVGASGGGKEHGFTVIEDVLAEAGLEKLIGPGDGYTSDTAVFAHLHAKPEHITMIDEFGALLQSARANGNFHKRQMLTYFMKVWGRAHGVLRPQGYSMSQLQGAAKAEAAKRVVRQPALTILGMTTPKSFYGALDESAIEGGFLNRLMIVQSHSGPQVRLRGRRASIPDQLVEWCHEVRSPIGEGNLATVEWGAEDSQPVREAEITPMALDAFDAYDREVVDSMKLLADEGLAEMETRSVEKAMRIAMILAVSENPKSPSVSAANAGWAIDYVRYHTAQTLQAIRDNMHGSLFAEWSASILAYIRKGGDKGRTEREMFRGMRTFAALDPRQRKSVLDSLHANGEIEYAKLGHGQSGRGKERIAWRVVDELPT